MNTRKIAIVGGMGLAAACLIGAGAGATFTDSTQSNQTITAGTLNVQLRAPGSGATVSSDGKTVTLRPTSPVNSTFKTAATEFEITNRSNVPVNEVLLTGTNTSSGSTADVALAAQTNVCVYSPFIDGNNPGGVIYDGSLSGFTSGPRGIFGPLAINAKDHYTAEYYAGNVTTACGAETTASLTNDAQGGSITPQIQLDYEG